MSLCDYINAFRGYCEEKQIALDEADLIKYMEQVMNVNNETVTCMYKFTKGSHNGTVCGKETVKGYVLCKSCCTKKMFAKQIPGLLETVTDPKIKECLLATQRDKFKNTVTSHKPLTSPKKTVIAKPTMTGFLQYKNNQLLHEPTGCICKRFDDTKIICIGGINFENEEEVLPINQIQIDFCKQKGIHYIQNESPSQQLKESVCE